MQFNHDYEARDIEFDSFGKWLETLVLALEGGLLQHDGTGMQPVDQNAG